MSKIKKLNIISIIIFAGFLIAVIYSLINIFVFHLKPPYIAGFCLKYLFIDFNFPYVFYNNYKLNIYGSWNAYPPFGSVFLYIFSLLPYNISIFLFLTIGFSFWVFYSYENTKKTIPNIYSFNFFFNFISLAFLSYPFLCLAFTGNLDLYMFVFISLFFFCFIREKYFLSALILSIPIAMKGFAIWYLALFIPKKKYKEIYLTILLTLILTYPILILAKGGFIQNMAGFIVSTSISKNTLIYTTWGTMSISLYGTLKAFTMLMNNCIHSCIVSDHNIFGIVYKLFYYGKTGGSHFCSDIFIHNKCYVNGLFGGCNVVNHKHLALIVYKIFITLSSILIPIFLLYTIFIEKELWKQATIITICLLIFFPMTAPYKLILLYIPLWFFINSDKKSKFDLFYTICFGFVLMCKFYYIIEKNGSGDNPILLSTLTDPLILFCMLIIIVSEGLYLLHKNKHIPILSCLKNNQ